MISLMTKSSVKYMSFIFFIISYIFYNPVASEAVKLNHQNIDNILASNELVFINFYVNWIHAGKTLISIFDEAADVVSKEFPTPGKVVLANVDCDEESSIASRFRILQYPVLKLIRNGKPVKKEYSGSRSVEALVSFIKEQLTDPIKEFKQLSELSNLESNKSVIIGYFDKRNQSEYNTYRRVASGLKEDCQFHVGFDEASRDKHPPGQSIIVFRPDKNRLYELDEIYPGNLTNFDELNVWMTEKCVPLIREMTLGNIEELSAEKLPLLVLYYHPDDKESTKIIKRFKKVVKAELQSEKEKINFFIADGKQFEKGLNYFQKSEKDLPLIAIDDFKHEYFFPNFKDLEVPGKLYHFVQDLYSGKLHREYHYGKEEL